MGTITVTGPAMTADTALYRLMTWLSPSYPVGAFSYSHGIEFAVEAGLVTDRETLTDWVGAIIESGAGRADGVLLAHASRAASAGDEIALEEVAELAAALRPTAEIGRETAAQGAAFLTATVAVWPCTAFDLLSRVWSGPVAYPVAVGTACAGHGVPLATALPAFLQAIAANLVSAGVRLIPVGQTDGQRTLAALEPVVARTARAAEAMDLDDIGTAVPVVEWCSMRHETQYTRLFRS